MSYPHEISQAKTLDELLEAYKTDSNTSDSNSKRSQQIANDLLKLLKSDSRKSSNHSKNFSQTGSQIRKSSIELRSSPTGMTTIETKILRSERPIHVAETEEIMVLGERGILMNKSEINEWRGDFPLNQYVINEDAQPEVITKRTTGMIEYIQELAIRYLRPPTPPVPGEIVITVESSKVTPPAPPMIIRQQPPRPETPEPVIYREAPPVMPKPIGTKVITISGKRIPPPPRKVVIERLPTMPKKPQSIIVERWLPYPEQKRRVIFKKSNKPDEVPLKPKNVIVQWEAPDVKIHREVKHLGVIRADPEDYIKRYGPSLKSSQNLPNFVKSIKTPADVGKLAAEHNYNDVHELEGDLDALKLIDLDKEGLGMYKSQLGQRDVSLIDTPFVKFVPTKEIDAKPAKKIHESAQVPSRNLLEIPTLVSNNALIRNYQSSVEQNVAASSGPTVSSAPTSYQNSRAASNFSSSSPSKPKISEASKQLITRIFDQLDSDGNGYIKIEQAQSIFLRINSRLGRSYGEDEVGDFFRKLDKNNDKIIDIKEFRSAFEELLF